MSAPTTTTLTPDEFAAAGDAEVAKFRRLSAAIRAEIATNGLAGRTLEEASREIMTVVDILNTAISCFEAAHRATASASRASAALQSRVADLEERAEKAAPFMDAAVVAAGRGAGAPYSSPANKA